MDEFCDSSDKPGGPIYSSSNLLTFVFDSDGSVTRRGFFISVSAGIISIHIWFHFNMFNIFCFTSKKHLALFSEEVHLVRITAGVEAQHVVISSDDVNPLALYVMKPSMQGSRLEVVIEEGSTNSSQGLCRNVEVRYNSGGILYLLMILL